MTDGSMGRRLAVSMMLGTMMLVLPAEPASAQTSASDAFRQSLEYEAAQNYSQAISVLAPARQRQPRNYLLNLRLGWLYYLSGDYNNSRHYYTEATKLEPKSIEAKIGLLSPLLALERYSEAEQVAKQAQRLDAHNYLVNLRLAFALRMQSKFHNAADVSEQMLRLYPSDVPLLLEQGLALSGLKRYDESRRRFQQVLLLSPNDPTASSALTAL